jgi:ABC-type multidrug transport system permease subunit
MKILDLAFKDMVRSFRSAFALVFMFGIPLLMTGMFYVMFGNLAQNGRFNLPRTKVIVANLDAGGPKFQTSTKNIPGSADARTMGDLIVRILQSDDLAKLIDVSLADSGQAARAAVDGQAAQVAVIIPQDFSKKFADPDAQATIEFYQDPTLTIGPGILRAILNRFMDGMAGVKIAVDVFVKDAEPQDLGKVTVVVQQYLDKSLVQEDDVAGALIANLKPANDQPTNDNPLLRIVSPIMAGMMVFYAFFTGASTAQSILKEEEERTLPRLFTTPTPQSVILSGKFLAVFLTVIVQVITLIIVSHLIFGIQWGDPGAVAIAAIGIVFIASSFGIVVNSFMKSTKQGATVFGGVLTMTGMLGMIPIFAAGSPTGSTIDAASLLVPQGWAIRGILKAMNGAPIAEVWLALAVMLALSVAFFVIGVWRFNKRYA